MAKAKKEVKTEKNIKSFEFFVTAEEFAKACDEAYKKNVGKISVQGFRKGKAPRAIIERYYGKEVFYEDAINIVLPGAYDKAIMEQNIEAVAQPEVDIKEFDAEKGITFIAKVVVKPEFELGQYTGLEVKKPTVRTTEKEVDAEIERTRERNGRLITVEDRASENGDTVNIDYEGSVDGVLFDGGSAKGFDLKLGSGQFIPGFEDQLVGHNAGEDVDVNVTFPEEYHAEDLKGKAALFKVKINAIKTLELPELDDEFAKDVSEFDTFADYKADVKKKLQESNKAKAKREFENKVLDVVCDNTTIDIPEEMIMTTVENNIRDMAMQLQYQGMSLEMYMQYTGMTIDSLREQMKPDAEKKTKMSLILEKIAKVENIEVTDKDVEKEIKDIAEKNNMEVDEVKKYINPADIKESKIVEKTIDFIVSNVAK